MKKILFSLLILFCIPLSAQDFSISGSFPGLVNGAKVEVTTNEMNNHETVAEGIIKDGAFSIKGHLDKPTVCTLSIDDRIPKDDSDYAQDRGISFIADNVPMTVSVTCFDSIPLNYDMGDVPMLHERNVKVTGGKFQDEYNEWRDAVYEKDLAYKLASQKLWEYKFGDDYPGKANYDKAHEKELQDNEQTAKDSYEEANNDFIKSNPTYAISLYLQSQQLDNCFRFTNDELDEMLALLKDNGDTIGYSDFKEKIAGYRRYAKGTAYTDFTAQTPDDKEANLSTALKKGKWNLIDFWASWCGPCRASIPLVKRLHEENPNVNIVSVSCDKKLEDWKKAMDEEMMPWTQLVLSPDKAKSKVVTDGYKIQFIPYLILINPEGKVAYAANNAEEIISKLKSTKTK